uniref:TBC1 domain family member 4 n=1 Tax=Petromyzon marinus TaxID=7757 RepID=A0AAJ7T6Y2_PETMA|nr:TBC1 domain family member 1-like isoform X2 [Petromyzon marinus]
MSQLASKLRTLAQRRELSRAPSPIGTSETPARPPLAAPSAPSPGGDPDQQGEVGGGVKRFEVLYVGRLAVGGKLGPPSLVDDSITALHWRYGAEGDSSPEDPCEPGRDPFEADPPDPAGSPGGPRGGQSSGSRRSKLDTQRDRTMLFQVGEAYVTLVSPDCKGVVLERSFQDISYCSRGLSRTDHFGFICREVVGTGPTSTHICYVFQCTDTSLVDEIMMTLRQAFQSAAANNVARRRPGPETRATTTTTTRPAHAGVHARRDDAGGGRGVEGDARTWTSTRLRAQEPTRSHRSSGQQQQQQEQQQQQHHQSSGGLGKLEFLKSKASKGLATSLENIFSALGGAKPRSGSGSDSLRSRSNTFTSDSSRESTSPPPSPPPLRPPPTGTQAGGGLRAPHAASSNDQDSSDPDTPELVTPKYRRGGPEATAVGEGLSRGRDPRPGVPQGSGEGAAAWRRPPRAPRHPTVTPEAMAARRRSSEVVAEPRSGGARPPLVRRLSWRQQIFLRASELDASSFTRPDSLDGCPSDVPVLPPTAEEGEEGAVQRRWHRHAVRTRWRKAIQEQILLLRMDRENRRLQAHHDDLQTKRVKLDYEEVTPCLREVTALWECWLAAPDRAHVLRSHEQLSAAVCRGVPRARRGEIWQFLAEQHRLRHPQRGQHEVGQQQLADIPYHTLLKQLTAQQHAILIDLGRTFPAHPYFSAQLGSGQLALYNLLKAYSLLDPEVGYCQGLSFVAGVLLLHLDERDAFALLKFLMGHMGLRRQYQPDMTTLQIQMYQLSRLLHDHHRELHAHMEEAEIGPSLYAPPWFLTLFASQFPLGFVARVFDLVFLQGPEVVFKVALALLGSHDALLMQTCDSFESIVEFLKSTLPNLGLVQMEKTINQVLSLDLTQQLQAFEVEYRVLRDEMHAGSTPPPQPSRTPRGGSAGDQNHDHDHDDEDDDDHDDEARSRTSEATRWAALERENAALREENAGLRAELQACVDRVRSLEASVESLASAECKLRQSARAADIERSALLATVEALRLQGAAADPPL